MGLDQFLDMPDAPRRSLAVLNLTEPEPFRVMLKTLFSRQEIAVSEAKTEEYDENTVVLIEDGEIVTSSPLKELQDAILLVNSDLFISGARSLEGTTVPDVLDGLAGTRFSLRGYPESNSEKLLLILISRYIEKRAFEDGSGTLRSSFQRLSRLKDEKGTQRVYERLAETDTDVHIYGVPDWTPSSDLAVIVHGGDSFEFRRSWFVVHSPSPESPHGPAALLAIEVDDARWTGFWTYDEDLVTELDRYIQAHL